MTLEHFIDQYDKDGSVVLLEGKRNVLEQDKAKLMALGKLLALKTEKATFRSGNAEGADHFFAEGVSIVDYKRLQLITPYSSHRKKSNRAYKTISLDEINLAQEPEIVYQSKKNKKTEKLIDQYVSGINNRIVVKAAYIIRDTVKAIGAANVSPATIGIFYDDLENPMTGGTGHTMNICKQNSIPVINQFVWFDWLKEI